MQIAYVGVYVSLPTRKDGFDSRFLLQKEGDKFMVEEKEVLIRFGTTEGNILERIATALEKLVDNTAVIAKNINKLKSLNQKDNFFSK